jgi:predicted Zn-dependent protease
MSKYLISIMMVISIGAVYAHDDAPAPNLGDTLNRTITLFDEEKIGRNIYKNLQKNNFIINDFLVNDYITYLGNRLSRNISMERNYFFFITKSDAINAFAVPGGFMGFNAGLFILTQNEAQLAGVVAHELGHVVLRHSAEMMASSNVNSVPMWIGIFAGLLAGQTEASMASIQSGIGLSVQKNINLVRENEIESDNFAVMLMQKSNYDLNEMANFFLLMQGDSNNQENLNEYFMTHPLYKNRISTIKKRAQKQLSPLKNSTDDYFYVKNILESKMRVLKGPKDKFSDNPIQNHRYALNLVNSGKYAEARKILSLNFSKDRYNIYLASLMSEILWLEGKKDASKEILKNLLSVYPDNNAISNQLFFFNIKDQVDLDQSISGIEYLMKYNSYNPQSYKMLAEAYNKTNRLYKSKLALINYYNLKGNVPMAFKVIDDGNSSDKLSKYEKEYLKKLKNSILCASNPPLEPIFGNKTCN